MNDGNKQGKPAQMKDKTRQGREERETHVNFPAAEAKDATVAGKASVIGV